jgi:hypothetical protein
VKEPSADLAELVAYLVHEAIDSLAQGDDAFGDDLNLLVERLRHHIDVAPRVDGARGDLALRPRLALGELPVRVRCALGDRASQFVEPIDLAHDAGTVT